MDPNQNINFFDRAYINLHETYRELAQPLIGLDLMDLINAVAIANPSGNGNTQLYDAEHQKIYEHRTKLYIVQKTRTYILGLHEHLSLDENMATFVSLRQLKKLIKAFQYDKKRISCYSLIYIYIIYTLLEGKSSKAQECQNYLQALDTLVYQYYENNPNDQLAEFLHGCFQPINEAIRTNNTLLENNLLPTVPRNHPQDIE